MSHILAEFIRFARWQADGVWLVWLSKVIHIAPVGWRGFVVGILIEVTANGRILSDSIWPQRKQIVAILHHTDAKLNRIHGTILPDDGNRII